jgi:hypothetical protein
MARTTRANRRRAVYGAYALALALAGTALTPASASAEEPQYDPQKAGHPLRIAAYILHPVGVIIDYTILRPAYYIGRYEPFRTIFGVTNP